MAQSPNVDPALAQISVHYRMPPGYIADNFTACEVADMNELLIIKAVNEHRAAESVKP